MVGAIHRRLREETRTQHMLLEARADILGRIASPAGRRSVVRGFHRLHAEIEAVAGPWLEGMAGLEYAARRRTGQLAADLAALGAPPPPAAEGGAAPQAASLGEALGLVYVLEGSTLGGQAIRREALARGGDLTGLSFLDPYGGRVGERWRAFLAVMEAQAAGLRVQDAVVRGARAGFAHAELRLCGADPGGTSHG
ncbi:MAG: biliverdin-producing heme oxygenase [Proteobacteria bacterium]|nr:biliverdin-producing heme oxygenase [Pseudomonadota bacterium]